MEIARLGPFQKFDGNFSPLVGDILPYLDCPAILALSQVSNDFNRAKRIEARIESDLLSFGFTPTEIKTDARKKYAFFFTHAVETFAYWEKRAIANIHKCATRDRSEINFTGTCRAIQQLEDKETAELELDTAIQLNHSMRTRLLLYLGVRINSSKLENALSKDGSTLAILLLRNPPPIEEKKLMKLFKIALLSKKEDVSIKLIEMGANPYSNIEQNKPRHCYFHLAIETGMLSVVKKAISLPNALTHINSLTYGGFTPLTLAIQCAQTNIAHFLLENGADPNLLDRNGFPPLAKAINMGNLELVTALLRVTAPHPKTYGEQNLSLLRLASVQKNLEIFKLLLTNEDQLDELGPKGQTLLFAAAAEGDTTILEYIFQKRAQHINTQTILGTTPLHASVREGRFTNAAYLAKVGADPNIQAHNGKNAFYWAAAKGPLPLLFKLFKACKTWQSLLAAIFSPPIWKGIICRILRRTP